MSSERHLTKTEQSIVQKALHRSVKFLPDPRDDEIARLREALERIAAVDPHTIILPVSGPPHYAVCFRPFYEIRAIARAAIGGGIPRLRP